MQVWSESKIKIFGQNQIYSEDLVLTEVTLHIYLHEVVVWCQISFCCLTNVFDCIKKKHIFWILLNAKVASEKIFRQDLQNWYLLLICGFKNCKIEFQSGTESMEHSIQISIYRNVLKRFLHMYQTRMMWSKMSNDSNMYCVPYLWLWLSTWCSFWLT